MKFLIDEGNFNISVENTLSNQDAIDQANAFTDNARAKNLQIISVHNLPRINIDQSSSLDRSTVIKQHVCNVYQPNGGAVAPNTECEMNAAIVPDKPDENIDEGHGSLFDNSIETITPEDFHVILSGLKANDLEFIDQQAIADASIKPNSSDCKLIQDDVEAFQSVQHTIELLNAENCFGQHGAEDAENVDSKQQQKRTNISTSTAHDENQPKKQKLDEDASVEKKFKCRLCERQANKKYNLQRHMRKHKLHQCDICKMRFVEEAELAAHLEEIHVPLVILEKESKTKFSGEKNSSNALFDENKKEKKKEMEV